MAGRRSLPHAAPMTTTPTSRPELLSGRTLFRAGLALLVLAAAFFLRYSIEQGWIGPVARIGLAAGAGLTMIGAGLAVDRRRPAYGILLQGAGAAVLFMTGFAAHDHYGLTSGTESFIQLVAVSTLTLGLAHRANSELLAGMGLGAAAAAPALIDGRMSLVGAETAYLAVIGVISTVIFFRSGWWRAHTFAAITVLASATLDLSRHLDSDTSAAVALESALVLGWLMLVVAPLVAAFRRVGPAVSRTTLPIITSSVGSLVLYAGTRAIYFDQGSPVAWTGLAVALAVGHLAAARVLNRRPEAAVLAACQLIPAVSLAIVAAVEGLTGDWVMVGFSLLAIALVVAGHHGGHRHLADAGHVLFLLTAVMAVGVTAVVTSGSRVPTQLIPGAVVLITAATIGWLVRFTPDRDIAAVYLAGAYVGTLAWMAVEFPRLGRDGLAWVTAGWAVIGVGSIVLGRLADSRPVLGAGFAAVGLALGKLFFVDLAEASPVVRIALFAGVGILLVGGGYWLGDWSLDGQDAASETETTSP